MAELSEFEPGQDISQADISQADILPSSTEDSSVLEQAVLQTSEEAPAEAATETVSSDYTEWNKTTGDTSVDDEIASETDDAELLEKGPNKIVAGFNAFREVHAASKEHGSAAKRMQEIMHELEEDQAELDHRNDIESHFDSIIEEQSAERDDAQQEFEQIQADISRLNEEKAQLSEKLKLMLSEHEEQLRPYKKLMDSSRSRADDAARNLSEAKRAVKAAEAQVTEAVNRRESRIAQANKALDNAQDRLQRLERELRELQDDGSGADPKAIEELNATIATERAHLSAARNDIPAVAQDAQKAVDSAQEQLWAQKQTLEDLDKAAEASKREATQRRDEYEKLRAKTEAEQKALKGEISSRESQAKDLGSELELCQQRIDDAQALIDEANDIHATPEISRELAARISDQQAALDVQQRQVDELAATEKSLRERTRQERIIFVFIVVAVVLIVVLAVWLIAGGWR